jgi:hypothetical protein
VEFSMSEKSIVTVPSGALARRRSGCSSSTHEAMRSIVVCERRRATAARTKRLRGSRRGAGIAAPHMNVMQAIPPRMVRATSPTVG